MEYMVLIYADPAATEAMSASDRAKVARRHEERSKYGGSTTRSAWTAPDRIVRLRMADPYQLERFVDAQDMSGTYDRAVSELRAGQKQSHWMWFVFPQVAGLGYSSTSQKFAITSVAEARAYLRHPVLGARLTKCAQIVVEIKGKSAAEIFGPTDAMKLRSSMTLFMSAAPDESVFRAVLDKYFDGSPDENTIGRL